jgi:hypothetical protein
LNDADEVIGEALLLLERGLALHVAIERCPRLHLHECP